MKRKAEVPFAGAITQKFDSKILYSLLAVLLTIAIVPLVLYGVKSMDITSETLETNLQELQLNLAASVAHEVTLYLDSVQAQIGVLAKALEIRGPDTELKKSFEDLKRGEGGLVNIVSDGGSFYSVRVFDSQGKWTEAGYSVEDKNVNADLQDAFFAGLEGRPYVSPIPAFSQSLQEPVLVLGRPMYSRGQVAGVVAAVATLDPILRSLIEKSREGMTAYLIDKAGTIFAHPLRQKLLERSSIADTTVFKEMISARGVAATNFRFDEKTPSGDVAMVATFDWVPRMNWGVVVQVEARRVYFPVQQMLRNTFQWGLIAIVAAIGVGVFFAKRISTPIQLLAKGASAMAEKDFSHKIEVRSRNEIGQLAATFNIMSDEIHDYVEKLKDAAEENSQLFLGSIKMLAAAIDEKDPYTRGHSDRVSRYSKAIARHMGLPAAEVERVGISALLHDVGKIGIKDNVLRKPDALTSEEFELMKQHPIKGATIMTPVSQLRGIIPGIRNHHENYDGSGYPDKMKGEEIPLVARIVSVADTFDAMTTDRPYQRAMDAEYAMGKIASWIGKRFDGRVVEALGKAVEAGEIRLMPAARAVEVRVPQPVEEKR
ncbi:MAG: HD domain-containing protein [Acidobacteria bacterium]|nr:HD domain-containing protein [Acidobacteriota bacterium]